MKLLTSGNPKILKGQKKGYMSFILHLAPAKLSGYNVCPMASVGCAAACLNTAGRGGMFRPGETTNIIQEARIRKTRLYFEYRPLFLTQLVNDIKLGISQATRKGLIPCFRLNGTSDITWENVGVEGNDNIMSMFPDIQFYDYTKRTNRKKLPKNYHLTFSRSEANDSDVVKMIKSMNVAVVFKSLPPEYLGLPVINGDDTDLRFLDPNNVIVGLKAKGRGKKDSSGFVL